MQLPVFICSVLFVVSFVTLSHSSPLYEKLGRLNIKNPSFCQVYDDTLYVTSFSPLPFSSAIHKVSDLSKQATAFGNATIYNYSSVVAEKLLWPNAITPLPQYLGVSGIAVADGFLLPLHSNGGIYLLSDEDHKLTRISMNKSDWFYHRVIFHDVNNDGMLDILTARATVPLLGKPDGELVWLENPGNSTARSVETEWREHVLVKGPDVWIEVMDTDANGNLRIAAGEFFSEKLSIVTISNKGAYVSRMIIEDSIGPMYSVTYVDVNGDGVRDLLVTTHVENIGGGVFAFEGPLFHVKHELASGFKVTAKGIKQASPGFVTVVPSATSSQPRALLVAGDGSEQAYILSPVADNEWRWDMITIEVGDVVGIIPFVQMDDAAKSVVFFVPNHDRNYIDAYLLK